MSIETAPQLPLLGTSAVSTSGPPAIDISPVHLALVQAILREHLPTCEVRAFGSRVDGNVKRFSDLDLIVVSAHALSARVLSILADAFAESDLPFKVDVVDASATDPGFRERALAHSVLVQAV